MKVLYIDQTGQLGGGEIALLPWLQRNAEDARMVLLEDGPFRPLLEQAGIPVEVVALESVKAVRRESGPKAILAAIPAFLRVRTRLRRLAAEVIMHHDFRALSGKPPGDHAADTPARAGDKGDLVLEKH